MVDVDKLEVGRELDALVEVRWFGGTCARCDKTPATLIINGVVYCSAECEERISDYTLDDYEQNRRQFSEDIAAAWQIVEKMRGRFSWWNRFSKELQQLVSVSMDPGSIVAESFVWRLVQPVHICKAALKVGEKE